MNFNFYILFLIFFYILKCRGQDHVLTNTSTSINNIKVEIKPSAPLIDKEGKINTTDAKNKTEEKLPEKSDLSESNAAANRTTSLFANNVNTDAVFRGFYVVLGIGSLFLFYIGIKTFRLKRHRATNRYKIIAKNEDRESFFPLAADEGEDEEIFNASNPQGTYS